MDRKLVVVFAFIFLSADAFAQFKLYEKGHDSYSAGKYQEAISSFSEYLTKFTRDKAMDVEVYYLRGLSYFKTGDFKNAIGDFEETLLLNHTNKGNIYWFKAKCHDKTGQNAEAIEEYTNAIRELGSDKQVKAKLLLERGQVHQKAGSPELAREDFQNGLLLSPGNPDLKKLADQAVASRTTPASDKTKDQQLKDQKTTVQAGNEQTTSGNVTTAQPTLAKNEQVKNNAKADEPSQQNNATSAGQTKTGDQKVKSIFAQKKSKDTSVPAQQSTTPVVTPPVESTAAAPTLADLYKDEKRYALIIGNSAYPKTIGVLRNPVNDASDLAKELQSSNFEVQLLLNATYGQMRAAMLKFKEKIDAGEKDKTVSLFYFAGHGLQHEEENYLVPIDAMIEYQDDISRYCFGVQKMVLANMERSNSRMNIVILDACRNNPFPALTRSMGDQGLGEMRRARGSFIAYATAPGSVASDGTGKNGLYTQELLKAMRKPGLTIEQVFKEVRKNVLHLSNDKQNTWDSSNIIGEFYFKF
jgi:tetratricopeptide (TPR) repeat protein